MHSTFVGVPDAPVIALAKLRLERAKLKLPCETRTQAINILRSISPAIPKGKPLNIQPAKVEHDLCKKCGKGIPFGTPCKVCFNGEIPEHINCKKPSAKKKDKELAKLYKQAIEQVTW